MNCKQVEELLPLYVGHDLGDERARQITAHVHSCTQCARSAEEYVEAGQLTQQFAVPQFSEATYATVRQSVLREIEQESPRTLRELLLGPFQPRLMWAVSTAVLLAVCAVAYYFVANRADLPHEQQAKVDIKLAPAGSVSGSPAPTALSNSPSHQVTPDDLVAPRVKSGLHSPQAANNPRRPRLNQTAVQSQRAGEPPAVPGSVPGSVTATIDTSISSREPMRLEIQTRDPNIRIIWFSQPSTNEGSPSESSKGI